MLRRNSEGEKTCLWNINLQFWEEIVGLKSIFYFLWKKLPYKQEHVDDNVS